MTVVHQLVFSSEPVKQAFYETLVERGESPRMAEMLAARQAPRGRTDSTWMAGRWGGGIRDPFVAEHYRQVALQHGVNPEGKTYCSQLASFPGDPVAWVDSVADVKKVAELKGIKLQGGIDYTPPGWSDAPDEGSNWKNYEVSDDIVEREMALAAATNSDVRIEWEKNPKAFDDAKEKAKAVFSGKE